MVKEARHEAPAHNDHRVGLLAACGTRRAAGRSGSDRYRPAGTSPASPASGTASCGRQSPAPARQHAAQAPRPAEIGLQAWFSRNGKLFVTQRTVPATEVSAGPRLTAC